MADKKYHNVVATLLARDEEDILEYNIKHHIAEGVEAFIFMDNGSKDNTLKIAKSFKEVKIILEEPKYNHDQSKWVSKMAKIACNELNPRWIIHLDADEFWNGIKILEKSSHIGFHCINSIYRHLVANEFSMENMKYYDPTPESMSKVAHRPCPTATIASGNHNVYKAGKRMPLDGVEIHHYPMRTYEQWERKIVQGTQALLKQNSKAILNTGTHWQNYYRIYEKGLLKEEFDKIKANDEKLRKKGLIWIPKTI